MANDLASEHWLPYTLANCLQLCHTQVKKLAGRDINGSKSWLVGTYCQRHCPTPTCTSHGSHLCRLCCCSGALGRTQQGRALEDCSYSDQGPALLDYHQFHGADQLRGAPQAVQYPTQEGNPAGSRAQQRKPQLAEI